MNRTDTEVEVGREIKVSVDVTTKRVHVSFSSKDAQQLFEVHGSAKFMLTLAKEIERACEAAESMVGGKSVPA